MTQLPLPVLLTAQSCRPGVILSVPLNWNDMWAVQQGRVSQCWTLSLGDRHSRWCYLFKFRLFLCLFSGLSVGWKVFPLSHRSVLFCQPRTTQALLKDLGYTMLSSAPRQVQPQNSPFSIIGLIQMKHTLLCIMLTVCWPSLGHHFQRVLRLLFFFSCMDQVTFTSSERHT